MCGIVGIAGGGDVAPRLVESLKRLEYRGYDSAGLATLNGEEVEVVKGEEKLDELEQDLDFSGLRGSVGIGHTRWATHGKPSRRNAHPHTDCDGEVAVVHNGIVENYGSLKEGLEERGHVFRSDTDTEVIPHLLEEHMDGSLLEAVEDVVNDLEGSFAFCAVSGEEMVGARDGSPLVVGVSEDENFLASDVPAILPYTRRVIYLRDSELVSVSSEGVEVRSFDGELVEREPEEVQWEAEAAEKGGYEHYMLKEIYEQPRALRECLSGRLDELTGDVNLDVGLDRDVLEGLDGVEVVACGTSYHAGLYGAWMVEEATGLPVEVHYASEYRYGPVPDGDYLTLGITQSGETADTLRAMEWAKSEGNRVAALTNVVGSTATRVANDVVYIRSGPEIGVAASKTFTGQLVSLAMLAVYLGRETGEMSGSDARKLVSGLKDLPSDVQRVLDGAEAVEEVASRYVDSDAFFFIGREPEYPVALEGALKAKEISYVHSEGYPAGELKHGPLALVTEDTPVLALATDSPVYTKTLSNAKEVEARDAPVIAVASESNDEVDKFCREALRVPDADHRLSPVLSTVVLQLFAYYVARELDRPIDKPRNLAKSVTVE